MSTRACVACLLKEFKRNDVELQNRNGYCFKLIAFYYWLEEITQQLIISN